MPRSRCKNGSRKRRSGPKKGTCKSNRSVNSIRGSFGLRRLHSSRCPNGFRKINSGPKKGTCKANRAVYSKGPQRIRGSIQRWTPIASPIQLRRSSRLATKWTRNGHMRYIIRLKFLNNIFLVYIISRKLIL